MMTPSASLLAVTPFDAVTEASNPQGRFAALLREALGGMPVRRLARAMVDGPDPDRQELERERRNLQRWLDPSATGAIPSRAKAAQVAQHIPLNLEETDRLRHAKMRESGPRSGVEARVERIEERLDAIEAQLRRLTGAAA